MKQCPHCNALYSPRMDECPLCDDADARPAPKAWVRTKSKTKTRRMRAVQKPGAEKKRRDSKDPTPKSVAVVKRELTIPDRDEPPKSLFVREVGEEVDPATFDKTVEMSREFLAEHSSDILLGLADSTDEAFEPRKAMGDLWSQFQDDVPTAKVQYLGEDDPASYDLGEIEPDSYDLEDLVAPPSSQTIENILAHGTENPEGEELDGEFFVDLDALDQLWETSEVDFEVPVPTHLPPKLDVPAVERMKLVNQIVARSRKLANESPGLDASPPPPPCDAPRSRFRTSHDVEEWQLEGFSLLPDAPPSSRRMQAESVWAPRFAGLGLAAVAGWAYATAQAWPVVAALVVGALALLLLGRRSG